jgi:hypothetical protein
MGLSHPHVGYEYSRNGDQRLVNYGSTTEPTVIDHTTQEYTLSEQFQLAAEQLMQLGRFAFLLWPALGEGNLTGRVRRISIAKLDTGQYPDEAVIAPLRDLLRQREGIPLATLLDQIQTRRKAEAPGAEQRKAGKQKPVKSTAESATLRSNDPDPYPFADQLTSAPDSAVAPVAPPTDATAAGGADAYWR